MSFFADIDWMWYKSLSVSKILELCLCWLGLFPYTRWLWEEKSDKQHDPYRQSRLEVAEIWEGMTELKDVYLHALFADAKWAQGSSAITTFISLMIRSYVTIIPIRRGYYTAARRYEFYLRVVKTIFYSLAELVRKISSFFLPRKNKIDIFKPLCNFLLIVWTRVFLHKQQCERGKWRHRYPD